MKLLLLVSTLLALLALACERGESQETSPSHKSAPATTAILAPAAPATEPLPHQEGSLQDGDLIFQRSRSRQSERVAALTGSEWTHMGIVFFRDSKPFVLEAARAVEFTPFERWIARGQMGHYVVKRLRSSELALTPAVLKKMKTLTELWQGRPYDDKFQWSGSSFYCSELAYKLYDQSAKVRVGTVQKARDMNLADPLVKKAISTRFAKQPLDPEETIISPGSMFHDKELNIVVER